MDEKRSYSTIETLFHRSIHRMSNGKQGGQQKLKMRGSYIIIHNHQFKKCALQSET
jgi:hypothetical protein